MYVDPESNDIVLSTFKHITLASMNVCFEYSQWYYIGCNKLMEFVVNVF